MRAGVVSFNVALRAGRTVIRDRHSGAIHRERGMDGWILNLTSDGRGNVNQGPARFSVDPGELLLFKPEVCHDYGAAAEPGRWTHLWVYFFPRPEWFELLHWPEASGGVLRLDLRRAAQRTTIEALFEELIQAAIGTLPRATQLAMCLLEQLLLRADEANPMSAHMRLDPRIQLALDYIQRHTARSIRITELAHLCGLSGSRLSHLFRSELGMSPLRWLEQQRMERARELLLMSGRPIREIGAASGMPNPVWFSRCFRRHAGMSPRTFRERGGQQR